MVGLTITKVFLLLSVGRDHLLFRNNVNEGYALAGWRLNFCGRKKRDTPSDGTAASINTVHTIII